MYLLYTVSVCVYIYIYTYTCVCMCHVVIYHSFRHLLFIIFIVGARPSTWKPSDISWNKSWQGRHVVFIGNGKLKVKASITHNQ